MIKIKIDDKEVEVTPEQLSLPDGFALITPDHVPKGYFTQNAFDTKIAEITANKTKKAREELMADPDFKKSVLSEFNISLDESGKPKGLKPDFDPDEWKRENAKRLTEPLEAELSKTREKLTTFKGAAVKAELLKTASGLFKEEYTKSLTGKDEPFVWNQFGRLFDLDEDTGVVALKDETGFATDGKGDRITIEKYFEQNSESLQPLLIDKRNRSSGFQNGAGANRRFTEQEISKMSDKEYAEHREEILKSAGS